MKKPNLILPVLICAFAAAGCVSTNYYPSIQSSLPPKEKESVLVFFDVKEIPFQYSEIGRIVSDSDSDQRKVINRIRKKASEVGADAVILTRRIGMHQDSKSMGNGEVQEIYDIDAIAISRK